MKKLTIILALAVAALATAGMTRHPSNPLTVAGKALPTTAAWPAPVCPPNCSTGEPQPQQPLPQK